MIVATGAHAAVMRPSGALTIDELFSEPRESTPEPSARELVLSETTVREARSLSRLLDWLSGFRSRREVDG